jgi:hypothetical protein
MPYDLLLKGGEVKKVRGMHPRRWASSGYIAFVLAVEACSQPSAPVTELKRFSLDSLEGVITQSGVRLDKEVSADGKGSLQVTTTEPMVVRLFELGDIDIEKARLIYQAKIRT